MNNPMAKILDVILVIAVLFIFPILWAGMKSGNLMQKDAEKITLEFLTNVAERGYIDKTLYDTYLSNMSSVDGVYEISLVHKQTVSEPEYEGGTFTGNVMTYEMDTYTSEILDCVYDKGIYVMGRGDKFEITICLVINGMSQNLTQSFINASSSGYYTASMMVTGQSDEILEQYGY